MFPLHHRAPLDQDSSTTTVLLDGPTHGRPTRADGRFRADYWRLRKWGIQGSAVSAGAHRGEGPRRGRAQGAGTGAGFCEHALFLDDSTLKLTLS